MENLREAVEEGARALTERLGSRRPEVALVLGSGLSAADLELTDPVVVPADEIPHLPAPTVEGHRSEWTLGRLGTREVLVAGGRVHRYEGLPLGRVTFGVRVMAEVGCRSLVVTNAAGGIRDDLVPGTLMRITDHLNLFADSPLIGPHDPTFGERFVDLSEAYDGEWGLRAGEIARELGIELFEGIYAGLRGPHYETPAEVRMLRTLGADAVGMSTVPEVIVARQSGLRVFGLSLITNRAAGLSKTGLSHEEVLRAGRDAAAKLAQLLTEVVKR